MAQVALVDDRINSAYRTVAWDSVLVRLATAS